MNDVPTPLSARSPRRPSLARTIKAVAWGFFGVRKDSEYQEDIARLSPLHVIVVGFLAVLVFIGVLIALVKLVVAA